jgi:DNA-binding NarL/FixJ family response regulator
MTSAWARIRASERIVALGEAELGDRDLRRQILTALGEVIAFDSFAWLLLGLLAIGSDTRALARQMSLSEHTVQDHLKSIFAKTDARDRITLLSRALGTRLGDVDDRSAARGSPAPD